MYVRVNCVIKIHFVQDYIVFGINFRLCSFSAWLNNCIGHYNHRFFFMYMLYTVSGSLFLILFGLPLAYDVLWIGQDESWAETEPLVGHSIKINLTGHIIPILQVRKFNQQKLRTNLKSVHFILIPFIEM